MTISSIASLMARRLEGKVALITGGASGIVECTAKLFTQHGAKVVIADIQDKHGKSCCASLGPGASYIHCDVSDERQIISAVDFAVSTHGELDIMFNNAGVLDENKPRLIDNEKSDFEKVLDVNVTGVFLGIKHAARVMIPAGKGSIISTASVSSILGGAGSHAYCASKHAVLGLTRNAAVELGQFGIRVNCLSPFAVTTPLATSFVQLEGEEFENAMGSCANLKGVALKADDVANAAVYLASDEAKYVSGQNLAVDGGLTSYFLDG